jgi:hypothetical protein
MPVSAEEENCILGYIFENLPYPLRPALGQRKVPD